MQKKLHRRCSTGLKISFWLGAWNIELALVPSLQIKLKKYSSRKYVWRRLCKGERSWWNSKQNESICWSSRPKGSLKKTFRRIYKKTSVRISFLVFSCEFCKICKSTFPVEQHQTTASDNSSINSSERTIGKRNCKFWYKN